MMGAASPGGNSTANMKSLQDLHRRQDRAVSLNLREAAREFRLIERGLVLGWEFLQWLHSEEIVAEREALRNGPQAVENVCANLLHSAWCALVSSTRLSLWGAHVDGLTLVRSAFELAYHAEFFHLRPELVRKWDRAGQLTDFHERRRYILDFSNKYHIRKVLEDRDDPEKSRTRLFHELSTYGTHANPVTVRLRITAGEPGVTNLGYWSVGKKEATRLSAIHTLHVLVYVLSLYVEGFKQYLGQNVRLTAAFETLKADWETHRRTVPSSLSMLR